MDLNFNKEGNGFVAEFEATRDFNLHVERNKGGYLSVYQRTSPSGKYAFVEGIGSQTGKLVTEYDFVGIVYPKNIRVVSESEPTMAVVTFNA